MHLPPLRRGVLVRRYQRFFADVDLDGEVVTAHCANPGSMRGCADVGGAAWVSAADDPKRRLRFTLEIASDGAARVGVHPGRANAIVAEALAARRIAPARGYPTLDREVSFGDSRLDFCLRRGPRRRDELWIEVKSATMGVGAGGVAFPDAVTTRGVRHLAELTALRRRGARAMLLFLAPRTDARWVRPADEIDPVYGRALRAARAAGVEVVAYRGDLTDDAITLGARLPLRLG